MSGRTRTFVWLRAIAVLCIVFAISDSRAQFSKPVVVLKGSVTTGKSKQPVIATVSIRPGENTASEITNSTTNKETGKYLVILQPGKTYQTVITSPGFVEIDTMISTPNLPGAQNFTQDFSLTPVKQTAAKTKVKGKPANKPATKKKSKKK